MYIELLHLYYDLMSRKVLIFQVYEAVWLKITRGVTIVNNCIPPNKSIYHMLLNEGQTDDWDGDRTLDIINRLIK